MARAILIDLDDTLVAFEEVAESSWRQVCGEYARSSGVDPELLVRRILEESGRYWGDPDRHRWGRAHMVEARRHLLTAAFSGLGRPAADAVALADRYSVVRLENMYLLPGVHEVLNRLRTHGLALALVTNGDSEGQRDKIRRFDLERYFDAIVVEGEVGTGKPEPRIYRAALDALDVKPGCARMVGDNLVWDVEAPQGLGIPSVWVDRKGKGAPPGGPVPWRIIPRFGELPTALELDS